jgi:hypothetical protein
MCFDYPGNPQTGSLVVVSLAEDTDSGDAYLCDPSTREVRITCQKNPIISSTFSYDFRVVHILPFAEVFIVYDDTEARSPQFVWQIFSPQVPVRKEDRIRRQSM